MLVLLWFWKEAGANWMVSEELIEATLTVRCTAGLVLEEPVLT